MSTTLTWLHAVGTKTGTTFDAMWSDVRDLLNALTYWEVASSSITGTPRYIVLKRKVSGAPVGRILLVGYTSAPAGTQPVLFDTAPNTNEMFISWFPNGNVDTPSNLAAASGTVLGNDTGALKVPAGLGGSAYTTSIAPHVFESEEALYLCFQNPAAASMYSLAAGQLVVDENDDAYHAVHSTGISTTWSLFGSATSPMMPWSPTNPNSGNATTSFLRVNYGANNRFYYQALLPAGSMFSQTRGGTADMFVNATLSKAWFMPALLMGNAVKGEGINLKFRQLAYGSQSIAAFQAVNTSGPVVAARSMSSATSGANSPPWMTNFKI